MISKCPDITIYTDATLDMHDVYDETHNMEANGFWSLQEQQLHINILELKACEIGLYTFCKEKTNAHVRLYTDNTTSCVYINKYGGGIKSSDEVSRRLRFWCIEMNIILTAFHIPCISNIHCTSRQIESNG